MNETQTAATPATVAAFLARRRLPELARHAGSSPAGLAAYRAAREAARMVG